MREAIAANWLIDYYLGQSGAKDFCRSASAHRIIPGRADWDKRLLFVLLLASEMLV